MIIVTILVLTAFSNPIVYRGAMRHLSVRPENCAMVAAHIYDLEAASKAGMKTIYIPRLGEDNLEEPIRSKKDGGQVDIVVYSLVELGEMFGK